MSICKEFDSHWLMDVATGCWNWQRAKSGRGYGKLLANGRVLAAHRYSWALHRGAIPVGAHVLHRCDNRLCVNPGHLFVGSHEDNMRDMTMKGRSGKAKLFPQDIERVREIWRTGRHTQKQIAGYFGVTHSAIGYVVRGDTWKGI